MILPTITRHRQTTVALRSGNGKVGPGVVCTYRPVGPTCPPECPLLVIDDDGEPSGPCYALKNKFNGCGRVQANAVNNDQSILTAIGAPLVRHLVSGDGMRRAADGRAIVDREYWAEVRFFHEVSPRTIGWGYTHAWRRLDADMFADLPNVQFLASVNSKDEKRVANEIGWRTARVTTDLRDREPDEVVCPYDAQPRGRKSTNCVQCRKCWESDQNILFQLS